MVPISLFSATETIFPALNYAQNTNKTAARHTSQPWRPPSSHGRLGAPHPAPRHTTTSQDHRPSFLLVEDTVGRDGMPLRFDGRHGGGGVDKTILASNYVVK